MMFTENNHAVMIILQPLSLILNVGSSITGSDRPHVEVSLSGGSVSGGPHLSV